MITVGLTFPKKKAKPSKNAKKAEEKTVDQETPVETVEEAKPSKEEGE